MDQIIKMVADEGAAFLTIHGRLAKQGHSGIVDIESIKRAKELSTIPVVGNGDVFNYRTYALMKKLTNVDAIMIGRAAMGYPETFADIISDSDNGSDIESKDQQNAQSLFNEELKSERKINSPEKIQEYIKLLLSSIESFGPYYNNENFKTVELRRNAIWMMKGAYNSAKIREKVGRTKKLNELIEYVFSSQFVIDLTKIDTA